MVVIVKTVRGKGTHCLNVRVTCVLRHDNSTVTSETCNSASNKMKSKKNFGDFNIQHV